MHSTISLPSEVGARAASRLLKGEIKDRIILELPGSVAQRRLSPASARSPAVERAAHFVAQSRLSLASARSHVVESVAHMTPSWRWLLAPLVVIVIGLYLLVNLFLFDLVSPAIGLYVVQPVAWTLVAGLGYMVWRRGSQELPAFSRILVGLAFLAGLCEVAIFTWAGLAAGFGHSPYARRLLPLLQNTLYFTTLLIGVEMSRAAVIGILGRRYPTLAVALATVILSVISVPFARFRHLDNVGFTFETVGEYLIPGMAENLLASFLALLGGPLAALAYRLPLEAFRWWSPILPSLNWLVIAFIGTLTPVAGLWIIRTHYETGTVESPEDVVEEKTRQSSLEWLFVVLVAVVLVWFNMGFLGIQPSVVSGVSMNPTLVVGDIVIIQDVDPEDVEIGDIVRYQLGSAYVIHRVVEIYRENGTLTFVTQGDNNNTVDTPLAASRIEGKIVLVIPKVGWVAIAVHKVIGWFI